jgi:hypothetical protein
LKNFCLQRVLAYCMTVLAAMYSAASFATSITPFTANIGFNETLGPPTSTCFLTGAISGTGTATKLGAVSLASEDCINPISATTFVFTSDKVVLGAKGDQIWAAYAGTLSATDHSIHGTFVVFGGTGRFKDARGIGVIDGSEDLSTGTGQIQLKGALSY